jgi:hypothetical protein
MMVCDGDVVQYNQIISGPISLYAAKLTQFALMHKAKDKKPPAETIRKIPKK